MSGHSKWSKVKHQKATTDVVKGLSFTKASHTIATAVREGGGNKDPETNVRLRLAIEKARSVNMPKDNIQRAIDRAVDLRRNDFEQVIYEGYGPGGTALIIKTATDNRQRTVSVIKNVLEKYGGILAKEGSVMYQFMRISVIHVPKNHYALDRLVEVAIAAGADDVVESDKTFDIITTGTNIDRVKKYLEAQGIEMGTIENLLRTANPMNLGSSQKESVIKLTNALISLDDVVSVATNIV